ncbi:hypothetical protein TA3x_005357 [Tundrisphaera sp. TA3]|uniref:hypothetical protein n=1 Tax=Tundrisphaera sp. TA3 TaxID=3435775 RepID=UPI003EC05463
MNVSPAKSEASIPGAAEPCGPGSESGKSFARAESPRHGTAGAVIGQPARDAAEVERLAAAFRAELKPMGEVGDVLVRRMAVHAVRMDRAVVQETAALTAHVREATRAFMASPDRYADNARTLRTEAAHRALFDATKEAILARKHEAASERAFHKALRELRRMRAEADRLAEADPGTSESPAEVSAPSGKLGSFFPAPSMPEASAPKLKAAPAMHRDFALTSAFLGWEAGEDGRCDIPIAVGRAR